MFLSLASQGLSLHRQGKKWFISHINGCLVEKQLIIDSTGEVEVKALGNSIGFDHDFFLGDRSRSERGKDDSLMFLFVNKLSHFEQLIDRFKKATLCNGIGDQETLMATDDPLIVASSTYCNFTQKLRHTKCRMLVMANQGAICKACKTMVLAISKFRLKKGRRTNAPKVPMPGENAPRTPLKAKSQTKKVYKSNRGPSPPKVDIRNKRTNMVNYELVEVMDEEKGCLEAEEEVEIDISKFKRQLSNKVKRKPLSLYKTDRSSIPFNKSGKKAKLNLHSNSDHDLIEDDDDDSYFEPNHLLQVELTD